jgi:hypothetical protein
MIDEAQSILMELGKTISVHVPFHLKLCNEISRLNGWNASAGREVDFMLKIAPEESNETKNL